MRQNQGKLTIRFATRADTPDVIALWEQCFPGDAAFQTYYFSNLYNPHENLLLLQGNTLCAMTQMLPYHMQNGSKTEDVTYIYGACTHPAFRRQHLMDTLLHRSFQIDKECGRAASILIPQEDWLFSFYAQYGYEPSLMVSQQEYSFAPPSVSCSLRPAEETDLSEMDAIYHAQLWSAVYPCRHQQEWEKQINMFRGCGGNVFCAEYAGQIIGYAFVWPTEQTLWIQELVSFSDWEFSVAAAVMQYFHQEKCLVMGLQFSKRKALGCVLRHDGAHAEEGYINLMLN